MKKLSRWNPLGWVRWKVVAGIVVLVVGVRLLGLSALLLSRVNEAGKTATRARWSAADLDLGLLSGNLGLQALSVATASAAGKDSKEDVLAAALAKLDLSVSELLRGQYVVEEVRLDGPELSVRRREDGSINLEDFGEPEAAPPSPEQPPVDWWETIQRWYKRLEAISKRLPERKPPGEVKPRGWLPDYSRKVTYPFDGRPQAILRKLVTDNLRIRLVDEAQEGAIPPIENGRFELTEVSDRPSVQEAPTAFLLEGTLAGARLSVSGSLDLRGSTRDFELKADTGDLPASVVAALVGPSLPVVFNQGTIRVHFDRLKLSPEELLLQPIIELKGIDLSAKSPEGKIAGLDAKTVAQVLNEAAQALDTLVIADLKISGTLTSPRLEWGDTLQRLVVEGAKAFANRQIDEGKARARKEGEKLIEKGKAALEKGLGKELDKSPLGEELKKHLDDLPSGSVEKGLDVLDGFLRGSKKKEKPAEPAPRSPESSDPESQQR